MKLLFFLLIDVFLYLQEKKQLSHILWKYYQFGWLSLFKVAYDFRLFNVIKFNFIFILISV